MKPVDYGVTDQQADMLREWYENYNTRAMADQRYEILNQIYGALKVLVPIWVAMGRHHWLVEQVVRLYGYCAKLEQAGKDTNDNLLALQAAALTQKVYELQTHINRCKPR